MQSLAVFSSLRLSRTAPFFLAAFALALVSAPRPSQAQTATASSTPSATAQLAPQSQTQASNLISAPVPADQQASLSNPFSDSNAFAADQGGAPAQSFTAPAHQQGPHHTLGKSMAIVGTIVAGVGVTGFALAEEHCKHYTGEVCGGFHTGGLAMMAAGAPVAAVGFYWEFQKPKQ